jgi:hypothetical protein
MLSPSSMVLDASEKVVTALVSRYHGDKFHLFTILKWKLPQNSELIS